ncbi:cytochrome b5 domain-containing protein [Clostridium sp. A1-XYC3]|uniref:Cytochrome b5 domain-containing protein n=1 Tax=Clostridium tanneri TaxID=3037988 RepID=A0ABU4JY55_9CLOT|nr:cytochrome b5 domain-containing protein [Clostridium sp. A1-XYC3]MDW8803107.1 cytochrome b5 domain-containing protein [Clostridium sp. A1-XYC3]
MYKHFETVKFIQYKICYYRYMAVSSLCQYRRKYFINLMNIEKRRLKELLEKKRRTEHEKINLTRQREFTLEELAEYSGAGGKPAYVAINGVVYDVSLNSAWGGGTHFGLYSGKDLTSEFAGCHKANAEIINNLVKVGRLKI